VDAGALRDGGEEAFAALVAASVAIPWSATQAASTLAATSGRSARSGFFSSGTPSFLPYVR